MKSLITLLIATVITLTSFATTKPYTNTNYNVAPVAALNIKLTAAGKVSINWTASVETTSTVYHIQKSVDNGVGGNNLIIGQVDASNIQSGGIDKLLSTNNTGIVTWIDKSAINGAAGPTGSTGLPVPTGLTGPTDSTDSTGSTGSTVSTGSYKSSRPSNNNNSRNTLVIK